MLDSTRSRNDQLLREIEKFISDRVNAIAAEEIEQARERLKERIPELAAEIGVRLQLDMNPMSMDTVLQILIRPRLR